MFTILIADDEERIRRLVSDFLRRDGYTVLQAADGGQAMELIDQRLNTIDLIILDVMMPVYDGWSVLRHIRAKNKEVPVMMLTARTEDTDEVFGFDLGADDYITKPFSPSELVARVKAHMARYERLIGSSVEERNIIEIRGIKIDKDARRVWVNDEEKAFTSKEFDLLCFLAENPNRVFTK